MVCVPPVVTVQRWDYLHDPVPEGAATQPISICEQTLPVCHQWDWHVKFLQWTQEKCAASSGSGVHHGGYSKKWFEMV